MSTEILSMDAGEGFSITRFWGGAHRGICFQITTPDGKFIVLPMPAFKNLLEFGSREGAYLFEGGA